MKCADLVLQQQNDERAKKEIQQIAKDAIQFMLKQGIDLSPHNYELWFYTFCKAKEEKHLLTDKNLFVLYEQFLQEYNKDREEKKRELEELSKSLERVTQESNSLLKKFDSNIDEHSDIIDQSIDAIDKQDTVKMGELKSRIDRLEAENKKLKEALEQNRKRLEIVEAKFAETKRAADIDALTKLFNRTRFEEDIKNFDQNCETYSVVFIDVDNFKNINDTYGHAIGDRVLSEMGEILRNFLRKNTYAYRYGGEEFVVVLPDADVKAATAMANRLQEVIENRAIKLGDRQFLSFTASFGVTQKKENETIETVLKRADDALYEAKKTGKNRVVVKE